MPDPAPHTVPAAGRTFGRYRLEVSLGAGGTHEVWQARDPASGRVFALKRMCAEAAADAPGRERFLRAVQAAQKLHHPDILPVLDAGELDGRPYLTTDFISGRSFAHLVEATRAARRAGADGGYARLREEIRLLADVASAVGYAHLQGVVHGDLQPANILVDQEERVYVADFGVGWGGRLDGTETRKLRELGLTESPGAAPGYLSPEQAAGRGGEIGAATDIHALGALLYEVLTGQPPFARATAWETVAACAREEAVPPRSSHPRAPADLEAVCLKALEREPGRRYRTADAFAEDLRRWLTSRPVSVRRQEAPATRTLRRAARRSRRAVVAAAVLLLLAGAGGGLWAWRTEAEQRRFAAEGRQHGRTAAYDAFVAGVAAVEDRLLRDDSGRTELERSLRRLTVAAETLIAGDPAFGPSYAWRGELLRIQGRTGESDTDYGRACTLSPTEPVVWYVRGRARLGRYAARQGLPVARAGRTGVDLEPGCAGAEPERKLCRDGVADLERMAAALPAGQIGDTERRLGLALLSLYGEGADGSAAALQQVEGLESPEAWWVRGRALYRLRRFAAAAAALEKTAAAWPHNASVRGDEGQAQLAAGLEAQAAGRDPRETYQKAIEGLTAGLGPRANDGGTRYARGLAYLGLGQAEVPGPQGSNSYGQAAGDFSAAINLGYNLAAAYYGRGLAHHARWAAEQAACGGGDPKSLEAALADFTTAQQQGYDPRAVLARRAAAYVDQGHIAAGPVAAATGYRLAILDYTRVLACDAGDEGARAGRGGAFVDLAPLEPPPDEMAWADYRVAIADLTTVLARQPGQGSARRRRAEAQMGLAAVESARGWDPAENLRRALSDGDAAVASDPAGAEAYRVRGRVHRSLGAAAALRGQDPGESYRLAVADCDAALARKPNQVEVHRIRGDTYRDWAMREAACGQDARPGYRKAIQDYDAVLARDFHSVEPRRARARAWRCLGDAEAAHGEDARPSYVKAEADCVQALSEQPGRMELQTEIGDLHRLQGREDAAHGRDPEWSLRSAIRAYEAVLRSAPNDADACQRCTDTYAALAAAEAEAGKDPRASYRKAIDGFAAIQSRWPGRADAGAGRMRAGLDLAAADALRGVDARAGWRQVLADLTTALERAPGDVRARCLRAEAYAGLGAAEAARGGDPREGGRLALADCDAALAREDGLAAALLIRAAAGTTLGAAAEGRGEDGRAALQRAIADCDAVLARDPKRVEAFLHRGRAYRCLGAAEAARGADPRKTCAQAIADLGAAQACAPRRAEALEERARAYLDLAVAEAERGVDPRQDCSQANIDASAALGRIIGFPAALRDRGNANRRMATAQGARMALTARTRELAFRDFDAAIAGQRDFAAAYLDRAATFCEAGVDEEALGVDAQASFQQAVASCTEALRHEPELVAAWLQRGQAYRGLGAQEDEHGKDGAPSCRQAIEDYDRVLACRPDLVEALNGRGQAYASLGEAEEARGQDPRASYRKAIEDCSAALARAPDLAAALGGRGEAQRRLGVAEAMHGADLRPSCRLALADFDAALALRDHLVEVRRRRGAAWQTLGDAEAARGQDPKASYDRAEADFRAAIARGLDRAGLDLGLLLAAQERFDDAVAALQTCAWALPQLGGNLQAWIAEIRRRRAEPWLAELAAAERAALTGSRTGARPHYEKGFALLDQHLAGRVEKERTEYLADPRVRNRLWLSHYNQACILALAAAGRAGEGETPPSVTADEAARLRDAAFAHLDQCLEFGKPSRTHVENDAELESLRTDPRWARLLERIPR